MTVSDPEPPHAIALTNHLPDQSLLEEFAGVIAHELATPLAIIDAASEIALKHGPDTSPDEHRAMLEMIRRNIKLAELLLGRLGLARDVEAGEVTLDVVAVDLSELVRESVHDLSHALLAAHPVAVDAPLTVVIRADPTATREIVFNLLSNAAKYSEKGAHIEVSVNGGDETAAVVVRNHGSGVTPGNTERVFEKYQRGDTNAPGVGLGLFISRGLARAHGGDLTVEPADRVGSEFHLSLPVAGP
jgi:two-component system, OmpR family, sensor histidine kinase KdpD